MFSNVVQNAPFIELFNNQGNKHFLTILVKEIAKYWKFSGKNSKEYDNTVNNYIHFLNVGGISKMQLPSNDKENLNLMQSYIVLQLYVFSLKSFTIEISVSDSTNVKRRVLFSACSKEIIINALHCRIPLVNFPINIWVNVCIDVFSFVSECFKGQSFKSIDYICLSGNCKVRKIYGMRNSLTELFDNGLNNGDYSLIPKGIILPKSIEYINFNLNINILKASERKDKAVTAITNPRPNIATNTNTNTNTNAAPKDKANEVDLYQYQNQTSNKARAKSQAKPLKKHNSKVSQFNLNKNEINNEQEANYQIQSNQQKDKKTPTAAKKWNLYDQNGRKTKNAFNEMGGTPELLIPCIHGVNMDLLNGMPISNKSKTMKLQQHQANIPKRHLTSTQQQIKKQEKEVIDMTQESKQPLFNTFNYRNMDSYHWDVINNKDSIQEIVDFDTHNNTILTKKNDHEEIIYYDNHLKENIIKPSDLISNNGNKVKIEKMDMMDQLLNDQVLLPNTDANRPYTPPLAKLVPLDADDSVNITKINESIIHKHYPEMVYDESKGCYFNSNTKVYYDFKDGF